VAEGNAGRQVMSSVGLRATATKEDYAQGILQVGCAFCLRARITGHRGFSPFGQKSAFPLDPRP